MKLLFAFLTWMVLLPWLAGAQDLKTVAHNPRTAVEDFAGVYTAEETARLNAQLTAFFDTVQIAVVTVPSVGDDDISQVGTELFNRWGIGAKNNNGLLLLIAVRDHKMFAATGSGIQGELTDLQAASLQRTLAVPRFRAGQYYEGTRALLAAYIDLLSPAAGTLHAPGKSAARSWTSLLVPAAVGIIVLIIIVVMISSIRRQRRLQKARAAEHDEVIRRVSSGDLPPEALIPFMMNVNTPGDGANGASSFDSAGSSSDFSFDGGSTDGGGGGSEW